MKSNIKIAIIDSGINNCNKGVSVVENENGINILNEYFNVDILDHGTNIKKIYDLMDCNFEIYSIKVFHETLKCSLYELVEAIKWCINNDFNIINISAGIEEKELFEEQKELYTNLYELCEEAYKKKIFIVSAQNYLNNLYPAKFEHVIAVQESDDYSSFIQYDEKRQSYITNGKWYFKNENVITNTIGSSYATAYVGAIIGNLLINMNCTYSEIINLLKDFKFGFYADVNINKDVEFYLYISDSYTYRIFTKFLSPKLKFKYDVKGFIIPIEVSGTKEKEIIINNEHIPIYHNINEVNIKNLIILNFDEELSIGKLINLCAENKINCTLLGNYSFDKIYLSSIFSLFVKNKICLYINKFNVVTEFKGKERIAFVSTGYVNDIYSVECELANSYNKSDIITNNLGMELFHDNKVNNNKPIIKFFYDSLVNDIDNNSKYKKSLIELLDFDPNRIILIANLDDTKERIDIIKNFILCITGKDISAIFVNKFTYDRLNSTNKMSARLQIKTEKEKRKLYKDIEKSILDIPIFNSVDNLKYILP